MACCGSICVMVGDAVKAGDQLGGVCNSRSSVQPHLHFKVMTNENLFLLSKNLMPSKVREVRKRIGQEWKTISHADLSNGNHFRL